MTSDTNILKTLGYRLADYFEVGLFDETQPGDLDLMSVLMELITAINDQKITNDAIAQSIVIKIRGTVDDFREKSFAGLGDEDISGDLVVILDEIRHLS